MLSSRGKAFFMPCMRAFSSKEHFTERFPKSVPLTNDEMGNYVINRTNSPIQKFDAIFMSGIIENDPVFNHFKDYSSNISDYLCYAKSLVGITAYYDPMPDLKQKPLALSNAAKRCLDACGGKQFSQIGCGTLVGHKSKNQSNHKSLSIVSAAHVAGTYLDRWLLATDDPKQAIFKRSSIKLVHSWSKTTKEGSAINVDYLKENDDISMISIESPFIRSSFMTISDIAWFKADNQPPIQSLVSGIIIPPHGIQSSCIKYQEVNNESLDELYGVPGERAFIGLNKDFLSTTYPELNTNRESIQDPLQQQLVFKDKNVRIFGSNPNFIQHYLATMRGNSGCSVSFEPKSIFAVDCEDSWIADYDLWKCSNASLLDYKTLKKYIKTTDK